jgi:poly-gamma-glutamate synthase PgsB/CapB
MTLVLLLSTAVAFVCLILERTRLGRHRRAIELVIAVTGTRGKSSVTRMLTSVLRESGRRVLAKTTGSQAALILPDGSEQEIRRHGHPSIIEQKHFVHLAASLGIDAAVVEIMSIHPENHCVESRRLIKPDLVLVTNFRVDHTAAVGTTRDEVVSVVGLDVPQRARVFVPQQECVPEFRLTVAGQGGKLIEVPPRTASALAGGGLELTVSEFGENIDLVCAAARSLGVDDEMIQQGIARTRRDIGALRIWRYRPSNAQTESFLVNAFAANDPESTLLIHDRVMMLNLRSDRADRTLQWVESLAGGALSRFDRLFVCGLHAPAVRRRLRHSDGVPIDVLRRTRPSRMTQTVMSSISDTGGVVFGFGNFAGAGESLVEHWRRVCEPWKI